VLNEFYNCYKDLLSVETTKKQFRGKIWKLKHKYEKNLEKKNHESLTFSNRHEKELLQLSNELWREENGADDLEKAIPADPPSVSDKMVLMNFQPFLSSILSNSRLSDSSISSSHSSTHSHSYT
jgi:hypothetical protein